MTLLSVLEQEALIRQAPKFGTTEGRLCGDPAEQGGAGTARAPQADVTKKARHRTKKVPRLSRPRPWLVPPLVPETSIALPGSCFPLVFENRPYGGGEGEGAAAGRGSGGNRKQVTQCS